MKIYLAIKYHSNNQNRPLIEALTTHLHRQGHTVTCVVRDFEDWGAKTFEPRELLHRAFSVIEDSDLVLIEATEKGMGVGIEAGFSFARGKPIITISKNEIDISVNLRSLSKKTIIYSDVEEIELI
jgi:nucleoside 2-deoxyribosyltransferase